MERRPVPRWLVALAIAATLLALVGGGWAYRAQERRLRQEIEAELRAIATLKVNQIARWRHERLGDAAMLMESSLFVQAVQRWLESPQAADQAAILARFEALQQYYGYDDILLVDAGGQIRLSLSGEAGPFHAEARQTLEQALAERRPLLTDLHVAREGGAPHLGAVAPLYADQGAGAPLGAAFLQANAESYLYPLVQSWPTASRTAETLLMRRDGDEALFLNDLRHQPDAALTLRIPLTETDVPAVMAALGQQGVVEGRDYRGVRVVAALMPVPDSPWAMVAKEDAAEIYAQWRLYAGVFIGLLVALLASVLAAGYALWKRRETAHYRALVEAEAALFASEARHRTTLMSVGDAVISTDAAGRVALLNPEAERLTGWPQAEALGRPLEEVFRIINEESRQPVESPVARVLREGQVVGLANHTLLLARGGAEWPIADSGAPVRDDAGRTSGVVLVFRDQTEERAAQRALAESEARFRGLFEHSLSGVALHEMVLDENGQPVDYRYLEANAAFERHTGIPATEIVGRCVTEIWGTAEAPYLDIYARVALQGEAASFEAYFEGLRRHFDINAFRTGPGQFATVFRDVTAQKEAERLLRDSEAQLRQMIDGAPDPIFVQTEGRFAYVNAAMMALVGAGSAEEIIGRPVAEQFHPDYRDMVRQRIGALNEQRRDVPRIEETILRLDGSPVEVEVSATPLYYRGQNGALVFARDITARKAMEQALRDSEARYRRLFEAARDGILILDAQSGRVVDANPYLAELLGYPLEALLGKELWEIGLFHDIAASQEAFRELQRAGYIRYEDLPLRAADGRAIQVEFVSNAYGVNDETVIQCNIRDITARKQAEAALAHERALLRTVIDNLPDAIFATDTEGRQILANRADLDLLGLESEAETLGKTILELAPPVSAARYHAETLAVLQSGEPLRDREALVITPQGQPRWVLISRLPLREADGRLIGTVGIGRDFTALKEAQEALAESEARFRRMVETANEGIWEMDASGVTTFVNAQMAAMLGYAPEEMLGQPAQFFLDPEELAAFDLSIEARRRGEKGVYERRYRTKDGRTRWMWVSSAPIHDAEGRFLGCFGMYTDVTERKHAEEALHLSNQRLAVLNRMGLALSALVDLEAIYETARAHIAQLVDCAAFAISLYDANTRTLRADYVVSDGQRLDVSPLPPLSIRNGEALQGRARAILRQEPSLVCDLPQTAQEGVTVVGVQGAGRPPRAALYVPMLVRGRVIGLVELQSYRPDAYDEAASALLGPAAQQIGLAIENARLIADLAAQQQALARERALLRTVMDTVPDAIFVKDSEARKVMANRADLAFMGYDDEADVLGKTDLDLFPAEVAAGYYADDLAVLQSGRPLINHEERLVNAAGEERWLLTSKIPLRDAQGEIMGLVGVGRDISERKEMEQALIRERALLRTVVDALPDSIIVADAQGRQLLGNRTNLAFLGYRDESEVLGKTALELLPAEVGPSIYARDLAVLSGAPPVLDEEMPTVNAAGERRWVLASRLPLRDAEGRIVALVGIDRDITERKRAEEERERLEEQLRQAQKMEAVGRLAGGVAHDFNNMLQTILGYTELALEETPAEAPLHEYLREIRGAGQRSASLTRQLLAFARRQTIRPEPLDLNDTVAGMLRMLGRLIGEDIELIWKPGPNLGQVLMDPSQLDQVLANLVVNARDAINGVGQVVIETENVVIDEIYAARHPEVIPGRYVQLAVSDNGCGMDAETLSHLFEPFFTTKPIGEGTGLGLPTVYGIVKQNEGFVNVYSEVGQGTTFRIYLPYHDTAPQPAEDATPRVQLAGGHETVLLVEDEQPLLQLGTRILQQLGYTVLAARSPAQALALAQEHEGPIHLLVTDVVMPEMNGRELAERLQLLRPEMKCLYMSGYTANVIAHRGVMDEDVLFLQKPFTVASMAAQVRAALDRC